MGGCFSKDANAEVAVTYPKNKVVPEDSHPQGKAAEFETAVACKEAANAEDECIRSASPSVQTCTSPHAGPHAANAQQAAVLKQQPVLKQLVEACTAATVSSASSDAALMRTLEGKLAAELASKDAAHKDALEAGAAACTSYIERMLGPVVADTERMLSSHGGLSSAPGSAAKGKGPSWDTVETHELLEALSKSMESVFSNPSSCKAVCDAAGVAADALAVIKAAAAQPLGSRVLLRLFAVPCLNSLASMLGVILFRKVVLESQPALDVKADALNQLLATLQWRPTQLAACLEPHAAALLMSVQHAAAHGQTRAKFTVRRGSAFWDTLPQAIEQGWLAEPCRGNAQRSNGKHREVLVFPSFVDEWAAAGAENASAAVAVESGEGHGPRKEYFMLVGADLAGVGCGDGLAAPGGTGTALPPPAAPGAGKPPLLSYNRTAGCYWPNTTLVESADMRCAYSLAGWLLGHSILSKAPLGISLPPLLLHQLLHGPDALSPDLTMLEAFDPAAAQGVRGAMGLPPDQLKGMLALEGLPETMSAQQYCDHAVRSLLVEEVGWQMQAMRSGLGQVLDLRLCKTWGMGPQEVVAAAAGGDGGAGEGKVDVRKVFRVAMDSELTSSAGGVLGELLWEVLDSWPPDRVSTFLSFVTGSSRLPVPGTELMRVEAPFVAFGAAQHKAQLGMLPQAHTCDNLLELPNYWHALLHVRGHNGSAAGVSPADLAQLRQECARILDDRLTIAVTSYSGYGLDERDKGDGGGGGWAGKGWGDASPGRGSGSDVWQRPGAGSGAAVKPQEQPQPQTQTQVRAEDDSKPFSPSHQHRASNAAAAPLVEDAEVVPFSQPSVGSMDDDVVELGPEFRSSLGLPVGESRIQGTTYSSLPLPFLTDSSPGTVLQGPPPSQGLPPGGKSSVLSMSKGTSGGGGAKHDMVVPLLEGGDDSALVRLSQSLDFPAPPTDQPGLRQVTAGTTAVTSGGGARGMPGAAAERDGLTASLAVLPPKMLVHNQQQQQQQQQQHTQSAAAPGWGRYQPSASGAGGLDNLDDSFAGFDGDTGNAWAVTKSGKAGPGGGGAGVGSNVHQGAYVTAHATAPISLLAKARDSDGTMDSFAYLAPPLDVGLKWGVGQLEGAFKAQKQQAPVAAASHGDLQALLDEFGDL